MSKQIRMTTRPKQSAAADQWVETRHEPVDEPSVKYKRLTIDLDPELHKRLKLYCFEHEIHVSVLLRDFIEQTLSTK